MQRLVNWFKALFNRTMDKVEDPEMMLDQAKRDMQKALLENKERAIAAVAQRNQLQKMLDDQRGQSANLQKQAEMALKQGNRELALQLVRQKQNVDSTIAQLEPSYDNACATVENVKIAMRRQEEEVKKKVAEALALKAQWKQAQIQNSIAKALDGLNFDAQFETSSFGAAKDRISQAQSEASARQEMQNESIQGKVLAMQDASMDAGAETELQQLEEKLGMRAPTVVPEIPTTATSASSVQEAIETSQAAPPPAPGAAEKELNELEQKLNSNN